MKITCVSDLHGHYPELEGGDLLIISGDLTSHDKPHQYLVFREWLMAQKYRKKIFICGNHDRCIQEGFFYFNHSSEDWMGARFLNDSGTEFEGLKIWGSPWTKRFKGMNPHCMAFTVDTEEGLEEKWKLIPTDTDILVTHSPPYEILDEVQDPETGKILNIGSISLLKRVNQVQPCMHIFGHVHECGRGMIKCTHKPKIQVSPDTGVTMRIFNSKETYFVNASHVNENYEPVNKPITIEL